MKAGDRIRITGISPELLRLEATYTDPDYPHISDVLQQAMDHNVTLVIMGADDSGTCWFDVMFTEKDGTEQRYIFPVDDDFTYEYVF